MRAQILAQFRFGLGCLSEAGLRFGRFPVIRTLDRGRPIMMAAADVMDRNWVRYSNVIPQ